jgi:hypothetical protein
MNKVVEVTLKGTSALLMHAFPLVPIEAIEKKTPEEQAEYAAYRDPETKRLYVPSTAVQRGLVGAATYSKGKGKASLQKNVAACVLVTPDRIDLARKDYVIDSRAVVVPATKGRVIRHRPRIEDWQISFEIEYDPILLSEKELRKITDDMCSRVGLLDYRPEKKGPFGRSMVTSWKPTANADSETEAE